MSRVEINRCAKHGVPVMGNKKPVRCFACDDELKHEGDCAKDEASRSVCEGMYWDRLEDIAKLQTALSEVYALAGEDANVQRIIRDAVIATGGDWRK